LKARTLATALVVGAIAALVGRAGFELRSGDAGPAEAVATKMGGSGVAHPVTAVLLNFRSYDTWLELIVLVVAALGALQGRLRAAPVESRLARDHLVATLLAALVPLMVLVAGYLLKAGAYAPGGAFQAGAVLDGCVARGRGRTRNKQERNVTQRHTTYWAVRSLLLVLGLWSAWSQAPAQDAPPRAPIVYVAPIEGMIDLGLAPFVERVLSEAADAGAAAVVLEINTFGGRVDAAVKIRDAVLNSRVRTVAFVNSRAISAGALIALSAETIAMAGGGSIGAATPVQAGQPGAPTQPVEEKTVSYVRTEFRATAERRNRSPQLAEAMVDADVEIPGVIGKGKLLTLTTDEALKLKLADFRADTLESLLQQLKLPGADMRRAAPNWAEHLVRFLTHPIVSSLLITVAMLGIILELRTMGFGIAGVLGISSLALFLWGHWLVQIAGWEELLLVTAGVTLLVVELFFIPGFGIAGALGITALLAGLVLSLIGAGATQEFVLWTTGRVLFALLIALVAGVLILRALPRLPWGRRMILDTALAAGGGRQSHRESGTQWVGRQGRAVSSLRLGGTAEFDGEHVDVVSDGEMIDAGESIEAIRVDGNSIIVQRVVRQDKS
jgi:membrane-bound serine protease (ClpP class)